MCPHLKFLLPGFCRYVSCLSTSLEQRLSGFRQYFRFLPPAGQCRQDSGSVSYWSAEPYGLSSNRTGFTCNQPFRLITKPKEEGFLAKQILSLSLFGVDRRIFALNKTVVCDPQSHNRIPAPGKTLFHIYRPKKAQNGPACCGTTYSDPAPVPAPEWYGAATCLPGSTG